MKTKKELINEITDKLSKLSMETLDYLCEIIGDAEEEK